MKILLDECVPLQVRHALANHEVTTAQRMGWGGISNGDLLDKAEREGFQVFILADKNLRYQQNLKDRAIAIEASSVSKLCPENMANAHHSAPGSHSRQSQNLLPKTGPDFCA